MDIPHFVYLKRTDSSLEQMESITYCKGTDGLETVVIWDGGYLSLVYLLIYSFIFGNTGV
jgi:hypothetical protein